MDKTIPADQATERSREDELILLLEEIRIDQFLFDQATRERVQAVLDKFSDDEFAQFCNLYRQRFLTMH